MFPFSSEKFVETEQRRAYLRRVFRRVFLEEWGIKLIALAIAVGLWLGVTGLRAPTTRRFSSVALNPRISSEMEITKFPTEEVEIVISGDERRLRNISERDLIVSLDLTELSPGERTVHLSPETVSLELPTGVKLDQITPTKIPVTVERVQEREVPVIIETEGSVADGYEIYNQTVIPGKVRVRGPESFVKSLDSISTERIPLDNQTQDFVVRQVGLNVQAPKITVLDSIVDAAFLVGERRIERLLTVPFKVGEENRSAQVVVFGARSVIENLRPEEMQVELSVSDAGEQSPRLVLAPALQNQIEVRRIKLSR